MKKKQSNSHFRLEKFGETENSEALGNREAKRKDCQGKVSSSLPQVFEHYSSHSGVVFLQPEPHFLSTTTISAESPQTIGPWSSIWINVRKCWGYRETHLNRSPRKKWAEFKVKSFWDTLNLYVRKWAIKLEKTPLKECAVVTSLVL